MTDWTGIRFDPARRGGHVESHFLKLNDPAGRRALWLKATLLRRRDGSALAEGWAVAFERGGGHAAAKQSVPAAQASLSRRGLGVRFADLLLEEGKTRGVLEGADHSIAWDLAFEGGAPPIAPLPRAFYRDALPTGKLVTPHPDLRFTGSYRVDGEPVEVKGWRGMHGHNWGRRHPQAYGWGHCNLWEGSDSLVFEGITARNRIGPFTSRPLTLLVVAHEGERHGFVLPQSLRSARGAVGERSWEFRGESRGVRLQGRLQADSADFAGLRYEDPDGGTLFCLNSKLASGELQLEVPGRPVLEATTRAAALEIGTRDPGHGVALLA